MNVGEVIGGRFVLVRLRSILTAAYFSRLMSFTVVPGRASRRGLKTYRKFSPSKSGRLFGIVDVMAHVWQVQVTVPGEEMATRLAQAAVEARLAAGGYVVGPVTSYFWHHGEFGTGSEWQVVLKTTDERYQELEEHIVKLHPWDNPEITAIPLVAGLSAYLDWVKSMTSK